MDVLPLYPPYRDVLQPIRAPEPVPEDSPSKINRTVFATGRFIASTLMLPFVLMTAVGAFFLVMSLDRNDHENSDYIDWDPGCKKICFVAVFALTIIACSLFASPLYAVRNLLSYSIYISRVLREKDTSGCLYNNSFGPFVDDIFRRPCDAMHDALHMFQYSSPSIIELGVCFVTSTAATIDAPFKTTVS